MHTTRLCGLSAGSDAEIVAVCMHVRGRRRRRRVYPSELPPADVVLEKTPANLNILYA